MSLSASIRQQLLNSFRTELAEHVQTVTDGLLALEQGELQGPARQTRLEDIFRAAHSLKGAARAVGASMVEQLAHALESVLDGLRSGATQTNPVLFTACYQALDAIQAVQAAYEAGKTTPPPASMKALLQLEPFQASATGAPDLAAVKPQLEAQEEDDSQSEAANGMDFLNTLNPPLSDPEPAQSLASQAAQPARQFSATPEVENSPAPTTAPAVATSLDTSDTIRVSVSKLDALMAQVSELLIAKLHAEQRLTQIDQLQEQVSEWQKEWLLARSAYNRMLRQGVGYLAPADTLHRQESGPKNGKYRTRLEKDAAQLLKFSGFTQDQLRQVGNTLNTLQREYTNDIMQLSLVIDELEEEVKRVRMLPLRTITAPFKRMVRDLAQAANKEITLQIIGSETELDKRVLEQIKDPLIHLLRNAVDHGIEPPAKRQAMGKPPAGTITLAAEQMGQDVHIQISDDGAGLDMEAIRKVIARHSNANLETLTQTELIEAIFKVGVSTSPIITEVSGRGVGLDVVRRNVEALHGRINVDWKPGLGATFMLSLPLTLTSSRGLLVRASGETFVIPFNAIERILSVSPKEFFSLEGRESVYVNGRPVTVVQLSDLLELPPSQVLRKDARIPVVAVASAERRMALAVDELAGEQETVVKSLGKQLLSVGGFAGATVSGDGQVILILNIGDLIKLAMRGKRTSVFEALTQSESAASARTRRHVLVVDDSITTRTLEKNILEAAGYNVEVATDGIEAWELIRSKTTPDLVIADITMPRMDGFELTRRIKQDDKTTAVPVILVTSLDSAKDKAQGIEAGADAYIVKSHFDQTALLETIEQLM